MVDSKENDEFDLGVKGLRLAKLEVSSLEVVEGRVGDFFSCYI